MHINAHTPKVKSVLHQSLPITTAYRQSTTRQTRAATASGSPTPRAQTPHASSERVGGSLGHALAAAPGLEVVIEGTGLPSQEALELGRAGMFVGGAAGVVVVGEGRQCLGVLGLETEICRASVRVLEMEMRAWLL